MPESKTRRTNFYWLPPGRTCSVAGRCDRSPLGDCLRMVSQPMGEPTRKRPSEPVAIAVVVRDRFSMFAQCLDALSAHTDRRVRILVVVGAADDATKDFLRDRQAQQENLTLILLDDPLTQIEARQCALRMVHERFCVIVENDTIVHAGWLEPLLRCLHEESAAAVTPLVLWYRGIHAAGCEITARRDNGVTTLTHSIEYGDIRRRPIGYPESHCVLFDLDRIGDTELFDDVEPFDVDMGLTLRARGLTVFLEPESVVTYEAPPPYELRDIPPTLLRWDRSDWATRNKAFTRKWESRLRRVGKAGVVPAAGGQAGARPPASEPRRSDGDQRGRGILQPRRHRHHQPAEAALVRMTAILFVDNQVDDFVRYRSALANVTLDRGWDVHVALPRNPASTRSPPWASSPTSSRSTVSASRRSPSSARWQASLGSTAGWAPISSTTSS